MKQATEKAVHAISAKISGLSVKRNPMTPKKMRQEIMNPA